METRRKEKTGEKEEEEGEEERTYGPVVRNTCLREPVLHVSPVSVRASIRDRAKATMYYHR